MLNAADNEAMNERPHDPLALNVRGFCADSALLTGTWPLSGMPRLLESLFDTVDCAVDWSAQGTLLPAPGGEAEVWLHLKAELSVPLQCQRCLQAVQQHLQVDRRFRFVRSESEAERLDETAEEDVLVLGQGLNLHDLLEDELILALPLVPRHEGTCPTPLPMPVDDLPEEEPAPNPFAALAALRAGKGGAK